MKVIESKILEGELYQFKFPKSKKKRIRKKWSKNPNNWKRKGVIVRMGNTLLCSSNAYAKLIKEIK